MRRLRLKSLRAGLGPIGAEVELTQGDRDVLHPLFVVLRDRRALLYPAEGREDWEFVRQSVAEIRAELTRTLTQLPPESAVAPWLEVLRRACREYLDAVAKVGGSSPVSTDFAQALSELRDSFREISGWVAFKYELPAAQALVEEMASIESPPPLPALEQSARDHPDEPADGVPGGLPRTNDASVGPLVAALGDRDEMVRLNAMIALRSRLTPELLPTIEPLLNDRDDTIRAYAVDYYAELTTVDGTERIVAALDDRDEMVRLNAMIALRSRLTPELLPTIEPLLNDRDDTIRAYAVDYYAELAP
jgi:HEAT repeat protein